ncbi:hypothetical protein Tco_0940240 [Tanacetum coccineum]|uniref:Uncharacterized protein n=1 Tax=Tanacetum coccineum TaxID=301880 RepID=A0ABQ5DMX8_9ASTR
MWETGSYKTHEDNKNLYEALKKSIDRDHSDQLQANMAKARKKRRKRLDSPRTPYGSPPPPPPAPGAPTASGSSQMPPPPPPSSTDASRAILTATQDTSPINYRMNDDSIPDEQVPWSDDEDTGNDHLPKDDLRKDWWKPLPEEERPSTPKPA